MGEPVRIDDLARSMIRLMGLEVRNEGQPDGDIAIEYIGLRDGEKLHEELLLGSYVMPTEHPRIFKSWEPSVPADELASMLDGLRKLMASRDEEAIREALRRIPTGFPIGAP